MEKITLNADVREKSGKGALSSIRNANYIPAVVYGKKSGNILLRIPGEEIFSLLKRKSGENSLIQLKIKQGEKEETIPLVILKDLQRDCLTDRIMHIDFHRVSLDEKITLSVPVIFEGNSVGVKEGGILEKLLREVDIRCFPGDIPGGLTLDITSLELGQSLHVSDIKIPDGVELVTDAEASVASVVKPKEEVVEVPAEEEAAEVTAEGEAGEEKKEPDKKEKTEEATASNKPES